MKKTKSLLIIPIIALLAACNTMSPTSEITSKSDSEDISSSSEPKEELNVKQIKVDHYNISYCPYLQEDSRSLLFEGKWSDYKTPQPFDFCYLDEEDELPYLTLETYASLISKDFKDGYVISAKDEGETS